MKTITGIYLLAVLVMIAACSAGRGSQRQAQATAQEPVAVSVAKPERRTIVNRLELTGAITPYEQVTVYAKTTGYLKSLRVDIGDRVRQGDLLAEIDVPEMLTSLEEKRAAVVKAEASLEQSGAAVEQARADLGFQEINYRRLKAIRDKDPDVLPEQDVDQARGSHGVAQAKLKAAVAQVKVAEASVAAAKAELATRNALLEYARIVAPISGAVTERFIDPGALVQAASSSRTQTAPVVTIARLDPVRIWADVPEIQATLVRRGAGVKVQVPAFPAESFPARITRTAEVLDPGSRTLRVEIEVANRERRLRPGMMAKLELELGRSEDALTIPVAAIRSQGYQSAVFVVEGGKAKLRPVKTGLELPEWIQITSGLRGDEDVAIAGAGALSDGAPVRVNR